MSIAEIAPKILAWTRQEAGQALAEYGLILTFVAIALIGGLTVFGGVISDSLDDFVGAAGFSS
jgi:Flp pilus assembly pilin Flp